MQKAIEHSAVIIASPANVVSHCVKNGALLVIKIEVTIKTARLGETDSPDKELVKNWQNVCADRQHERIIKPARRSQEFNQQVIVSPWPPRVENTPPNRLLGRRHVRVIAAGQQQNVGLFDFFARVDFHRPFDRMSY